MGWLAALSVWVGTEARTQQTVVADCLDTYHSKVRQETLQSSRMPQATVPAARRKQTIG